MFLFIPQISVCLCDKWLFTLMWFCLGAWASWACVWNPGDRAGASFVQIWQFFLQMIWMIRIGRPLAKRTVWEQFFLTKERRQDWRNLSLTRRACIFGRWRNLTKHMLTHHSSVRVNMRFRRGGTEVVPGGRLGKPLSLLICFVHSHAGRLSHAILIKTCVRKCNKTIIPMLYQAKFIEANSAQRFKCWNVLLELLKGGICTTLLLNNNQIYVTC